MLKVFCFFFFSSYMFACSCVKQGVVADLADSDAVFIGVVSGVRYMEKGVAPRVIVTFDVSGVWKGVVGKQAKLHTYVNSSSCEGWSRFEKGKEYVVFATTRKVDEWLGRKKSDFFGSRSVLVGTELPVRGSQILGITCSETSLVTDSVREDLKKIGVPKIP